METKNYNCRCKLTKPSEDDNLKPEKTFKVTEIINLEENATLSLIDDELKNQGVVVIKNENIDVYYPDGSHEEFGSDFVKLRNMVEENGWNFIKLLKGDTRYKEYNPNPRKKNVGDCSIRAYCKATGMTWDEAFDIAVQVGKSEKDIINSNKVCKIIIEDKLHFDKDEEFKTLKSKERPTVQEFCLTHNYGTYILGIRGHLVTCVNGFYYDTWKSGDKKVNSVWIKPNSDRR
jgi:hypothetical protein